MLSARLDLFGFWVERKNIFRQQIKKNLTMDKLLLTVTDKRQTRLLVREGAPQRQDSNFQTELISGRKSHIGIDTKTYWLTDRPTDRQSTWILLQYTVLCLSKLYTDKNVCKNNLQMFSKEGKKREKRAQIGTNARARVFKARLLARSQFVSGRCCDRPTRFSVVFLGPRANSELVSKFHFALHASHAALPTIT
jgi:hypothetical protein